MKKNNSYVLISIHYYDDQIEESGALHSMWDAQAGREILTVFFFGKHAGKAYYYMTGFYFNWF